MTALALTITPEGIAAAVNVANMGLAPLDITEIGLLSGPATEIKRVSTFGGDVVADNIIHVTITDETADTYTLKGFRLYTSTGIIFAYYSQATPILDKTADALTLLAADIVLTSVPPGTVTIGGAGFSYPPATTERLGVVEIATQAEVNAGTDTERVITPATLAGRTASTTRTGVVELATGPETQAGIDAGRAVTPASLAYSFTVQRSMRYYIAQI